MTTIVELHRRAVTAARTVLDRVTPADLDRPTPCAGWDLRALLEHMTGQDHGFATALRATLDGTDAELSAFAPGPLGAAPAATLAAGLDDVTAAFVRAAEVERTVYLAEFDRRVPAPVLVSMHLVDTLVHGWDVAATLGIADHYRAGLDDETDRRRARDGRAGTGGQCDAHGAPRLLRPRPDRRGDGRLDAHAHAPGSGPRLGRTLVNPVPARTWQGRAVSLGWAEGAGRRGDEPLST